MKKRYIFLFIALLLGGAIFLFFREAPTSSGSAACSGDLFPGLEKNSSQAPAGFVVQKMTFPPEEKMLPPEKKETSSKTIVENESIAVPAKRAGYLRSDRPIHRTNKVYSRLVGNPYRGAIVVDAHTGRILFENHATAYAYPASITKLMTLLIVLEEVEAGRIHLNDKVAVTPEVARIGGSQIYLDPRESGHFTVDDLLYALIVHSANDAAYALALHVAGTREAFVKQMNQHAQVLGMSSTIYHSPNGLPPGHGQQPDISTPYDIALLCQAVLSHMETLRYTGTELKYLRHGKTMLATRNALAKRVGGYPGCDGLKTGYHRAGGWSIAATARRGNQRVVVVILGAPDKKSRNAMAKKLLDKGFEQLKTETRP